MHILKTGFGFVGYFLGLLLLLGLWTLVGVVLPLSAIALIASAFPGAASLYAMMSTVLTISGNGFGLGAIGCFFLTIGLKIRGSNLDQASFCYLFYGWVGGIVGLILAAVTTLPVVPVVTIVAVVVGLIASLREMFRKNPDYHLYSNKDWPHPDR